MRKLLKKYYIFCRKVIETFIQFTTILLFHKTNCKITSYLKHNGTKKLLILGNGPSLEQDLCNLQGLGTCDEISILSMNGFALSEYYTTIKPDNYIIIDPGFFNDNLTEDRLLNMTRQLQESLLRKTSWQMNLFFPRYYSRSKFIEGVRANSAITMIPINNTPLSGGFDSVKNFFFYHQLGNPIYQNVLIAAIFLGIQQQYESINLLGSDHNWFKNISVSKSNLVTLNDQHIDNSDNNRIVLIDENGYPKKLHVFINQIAIMFHEYHTLEKYAKTKGIKISNNTINSFIDAFVKLEP